MLELIVKNFNGTLSNFSRFPTHTPVSLAIYLNRGHTNIVYQQDRKQVVKGNELHSSFLVRNLFSNSDQITGFEVNICTHDATATGCNIFVNGEPKTVGLFVYNTYNPPDKYYYINALLPNLTLNEVNKLKIIIELI